MAMLLYFIKICALIEGNFILFVTTLGYCLVEKTLFYLSINSK